MNFKKWLELFEKTIYVKDNKLIFSPDNIEDETGISFNFGKTKKFKPFEKKLLPELKSYSLYLAKQKDATKTLNAIKKSDFNNPEIQEFLKKSSIFSLKIINNININFDIVVTPFSSSDLVKEWANELVKRTHYDYFIDAFVKNNIDEITLDYDNPKMSDNIKKDLERILKKSKIKGYFSIHDVYPMFRKFVLNVYRASSKKIINKVKDKNVIILDDIVTSGTTAMDIFKTLKTAGAKEVIVLTLFKSEK